MGGRKRHNGIIAHTAHSVFGNFTFSPSLSFSHFSHFFFRDPLGLWVWWLLKCDVSSSGKLEDWLEETDCMKLRPNMMIDHAIATTYPNFPPLNIGWLFYSKKIYRPNYYHPSSALSTSPATRMTDNSNLSTRSPPSHFPHCRIPLTDYVCWDTYLGTLYQSCN